MDDDVRGALATLLEPEPAMRSTVADDVRRGRALRMRRQRWLAGGVAAALVLGIAGLVGVPRMAGGPLPTPGAVTGLPSAAAPSTAASAVQLIGYWRVTGTEDDGAILQFGSRDSTTAFVLWRRCGGAIGDWRLSPSGAMVMSSWAGLSRGSECRGRPGALSPRVPWLDEVIALQPDRTGYLLLSPSRTVVAGLVPAERSDIEPDAGPTDVMADLPAATDADRHALTAAAPPGSQPLDPSELVGRWTPHGPAPAHLELAGDGTYSGAGGCGHGRGRWTIDAAGVLIATGSPPVAADCATPEAPSVWAWVWLAEARGARLTGQTLALLGPDGRVLGTLTRQA